MPIPSALFSIDEPDAKDNYRTADDGRECDVFLEYDGSNDHAGGRFDEKEGACLRGGELGEGVEPGDVGKAGGEDAEEDQ